MNANHLNVLRCLWLTSPLTIACSVAEEQLGIISVWTFLSHLNKPITIVFPIAPRPRFALTHLAPKLLLSTSIYPENKILSV
jgi:hypothetical protein